MNLAITKWNLRAAGAKPVSKQTWHEAPNAAKGVRSRRDFKP